MKIIKTKEEYEKAISQIESLIDIDPVPNTSEFDELELLAFLIEKYDAEHSKIEIPDPIEAIKFRMEQQNLKNSDLVPFIGSKSKVSEVLNRKRALSLSMIRKLNHGLGIPAEVLIKDTFKITSR
jgi:HTH-type transcriptional regulator/antitoxin HigA